MTADTTPGGEWLLLAECPESNGKCQKQRRGECEGPSSMHGNPSLVQVRSDDEEQRIVAEYHRMGYQAGRGVGAKGRLCHEELRQQREGDGQPPDNGVSEGQTYLGSADKGGRQPE